MVLLYCRQSQIRIVFYYTMQFPFNVPFSTSYQNTEFVKSTAVNTYIKLLFFLLERAWFPEKNTNVILLEFSIKRTSDIIIMVCQYVRGSRGTEYEYVNMLSPRMTRCQLVGCQT